MKVILLKDIKGVGKKDQIVNANDGYAKNYLLPNKLAVPADKNNTLKLDNIKKIEDEKRQQEYEKAKALADKIQENPLVIYAKLGNNGKLFGAVTNKEIAKDMEDKLGIKVDKKKISLPSPIKTIGENEVNIKLHKKVVAVLKLSIKEEA